MHSPILRPLFPFLSLLGALFLLSLPAHAQNELVPNPKGVKLHRVWTHEGQDGVEYEYGYNVWGGVDISGDSIDDFAVYRNSDNLWLFYAGGSLIDTMPFLSRDSMMSITPVAGDFLGDGRTSLGFMRARIDDPTTVPKVFYMPSLYWKTEQGFADTPWAVGEHRCFLDLQAANLDGELGDELMVMRGCSTKEVLIYKGGPDFTLSTPTVIISDVGPGGNNSPDNWYVRFADFDGDGKLDMVMGGGYPQGGDMLRFYWGDDHSPWSWAERPPDRDLQLKQGETPLRRLPLLAYSHLDSDAVVDFVGTITEGDHAGVYAFLSSKGNNRTRSFSVDDADFYVKVPKHYEDFYPVGYLNDSSYRLEMLPIGNAFSEASQNMVVLSGGKDGPNRSYDGYFSPTEEGLNFGYVFGRSSGPVGDVTGDGWPDYGTGNETYGAVVHTGIALILAGGPYIPFDDTTLSVQEVPVAGDAGGLYLWPNPVRDELNIAWKGNLKKMPARFAVYDMEGKEVVKGDVQPYLGAAVWHCASVPAGTYVLVAYDGDGKGIASARVVKQ